jgi:hypothetical protein
MKENNVIAVVGLVVAVVGIVVTVLVAIFQDTLRSIGKKWLFAGLSVVLSVVLIAIVIVISSPIASYITPPSSTSEGISMSDDDRNPVPSSSAVSPEHRSPPSGNSSSSTQPTVVPPKTSVQSVSSTTEVTKVTTPTSEPSEPDPTPPAPPPPTDDATTPSIISASYANDTITVETNFDAVSVEVRLTDSVSAVTIDLDNASGDHRTWKLVVDSNLSPTKVTAKTEDGNKVEYSFD